jgi:hypothetical protein
VKRLALSAAVPAPIAGGLIAPVLMTPVLMTAALMTAALITSALITSAALAACDVSSAAVPGAARAKLSGTCVTGVYDESRHQFYAMSDLIRGTGIASGDVIAEAYELTLKDTSPVTARVAGFSTAFYSRGREFLTGSQSLPVPAVLHPGQSRTLTEHPWGTSVAGHGASAGPFRAGQDGAVNTAATCRLIRWRG